MTNALATVKPDRQEATEFLTALFGHYFSDNDEILLPNEAEGHGRRRDAAGRLLPCRKHEARRGRSCLGCGCDHEKEEGRGE